MILVHVIVLLVIDRETLSELLHALAEKKYNMKAK